MNKLRPRWNRPAWTKRPRVAAEAEAAATQSAEAEAAATEAAEAAPVEIAEVAGDYGAADAAPGFPVASDDGEARTVVSVQVERLQRQFDRRDSAAFVAYRSAEGVVVVDLGSGMSVITELEPGVTAIYSDPHLLRSGASTFAVNTDTLEVSRVAENSGVVVSDTLDGHTYLVDSGSLSGQAALVEVVADGEYGFHRLPSGGLQIQPVDGLGILAVPNSPAGETSDCWCRYVLVTERKPGAHWHIKRASRAGVLHRGPMRVGGS